MSEDEIIIEILNKGEFQVSDKEREDQLESLKLDIANIIAKMGVNSEDGNSFPVSIILKAMNELNCKVNSNKQAKPQALGFLTELKKVLPIERAKMGLRITASQEQQKALLDSLTGKDWKITSETDSALVLLVDPSLFREFSTLIKGDKALFKDVALEIIEKATE